MKRNADDRARRLERELKARGLGGDPETARRLRQEKLRTGGRKPSRFVKRLPWKEANDIVFEPRRAKSGRRIDPEDAAMDYGMEAATYSTGPWIEDHKSDILALMREAGKLSNPDEEDDDVSLEEEEAFNDPDGVMTRIAWAFEAAWRDAYIESRIRCISAVIDKVVEEVNEVAADAGAEDAHNEFDEDGIASSTHGPSDRGPNTLFSSKRRPALSVKLVDGEDGAEYEFVVQRPFLYAEASVFGRGYNEAHLATLDGEDVFRRAYGIAKERLDGGRLSPDRVCQSNQYEADYVYRSPSDKEIFADIREALGLKSSAENEDED